MSPSLNGTTNSISPENSIVLYFKSTSTIQPFLLPPSIASCSSPSTQIFSMFRKFHLPFFSDHYRQLYNGDTDLCVAVNAD
ncbi:hypothetical protein QL285_005962 [Trifolium repens]|nr:hypothetical protein QL285_005962 [Trifolium repens]